MTPSILPLLAANDFLQCMGIGLLTAFLRALFPMRRGRVHFLSDFFCVGAALILLQSFAACRSSAGTLRWYMLAGLAIGAFAGEALLAPVRAAICHGVYCIVTAPFRAAWRFVLKPLIGWIQKRLETQRQKRVYKILRKKRKKQLQKPGALLYNSNV
jgi:hypothetical protein